MNDLNELTGAIIGAAIEVHRNLGPGLLESAYETCLVWELRQKGLKVEPQVPVPIRYKDCNWTLVIGSTYLLKTKSLSN